MVSSGPLSGPPNYESATSALNSFDTTVDSLSERIYRVIRQAIITKELKPGAAVTEAKLAAQLGVSKTPVREALVRLRTAHLVEQKGRGALRVAQPSYDAVREAFQVRSVLEGLAARLCAEQATDEECRHLLKLASQQFVATPTEPSRQASDWDWIFHEAMARYARNRQLYLAISDIRAFTSVMQVRDAEIIDNTDRIPQSHVIAAKAISVRDKVRAEAAMHRHFEDILAGISSAAFKPSI